MGACACEGELEGADGAGGVGDAFAGDAEGGAVVAIDVKTGQILVSASHPSYDPATYFEKYNDLLEAEYKPLINRALNLAYPPGSTYKMIPSIAAMENKIISAGTEIV